MARQNWENNIYKITIDGVEIKNYSDYSMIYQRSYLKSPTRTNGVIVNLEDYETINVPQLSFSFKYMPIDVYRQLMMMATNKNEFVVQFYDYINDVVATENMYFEPKDLARIQIIVNGLSYANAVKKLAILEESFAMVGTNSDKRMVTIHFDANGGSYVGAETNPDFSAVYSHKGLTPATTDFAKSGKTFVGFNTRADGTGNFYPCNWQFTMMNNMTLYAQYE